MNTELMKMPELVVRVEGKVTESNITYFKDHVHTFMEKINRECTEDEHFGQAVIDVESLKKGEEVIKQERINIINQTRDISSVLATLDSLGKEIGDARRSLERQVREQKDSIKVKHLNYATNRVDALVTKRHEEINKEFNLRIKYQHPDFYNIIKGLRTIDSIKKALKKAADLGCDSINASYEDINTKLDWMKKDDVLAYKYLFGDIGNIIHTEFEGFKAIINLRITQHKEAEWQKQSLAREKMRLEEEAKAKAKVEAEAKAKAKSEAEAKAKAEEEAKAKAEAKTKAEDLAKTPIKEPTKEIPAPVIPIKGVALTTAQDEHTNKVKEELTNARSDCTSFMAKYMNVGMTQPIRTEMLAFLELSDWVEE